VRNETKLAASESRYRTLVEASPIGIAILDADRVMVEVNERLAQLMNATREQVVGTRMRDFAPTESPTQNRNLFARMIAGEIDSFDTTRTLAPTGRGSTIVDMTTYAVRDRQGQFLHAVRIVDDVTAQTIARKEINVSEKRFRHLFDSAPIGISVSNLDRAMIQVNPALIQVLGRSDQELLGESLTSYWYPDYQQTAAGSHERLASQKSDRVAHERLLQRADGAPLWAMLTASAIHDADGNIQGVIRTIEDITVRKLAEEELRQSEERFRDLFEVAPIGIGIKDAQNVVTGANQALAQFLARDLTEIIGARLIDFTPPDAQPPRIGEFERMVRGDFDSREFERDWLRPNGERVWGHGRERAVRNAAGEFLYAITAIEDITKRRQTEDDIKASEERFRVLFESAPLGLVLKDAKNIIMESNPALQVILGRTAEQLEGRRFRDFLPDWFPQTHANNAARIVRGELEENVFERPYLRSNGTIAWARGVESPVRDAEGNFRYTIQTFEDITERRRVEEVIKNSEERFRALFDSSPVGIALVDGQAIITSVNPQLEILLGYPADEIIGHTLSVFRSPDDIGTGLHRTVGLVAGDTENCSSERLHRRKNGEDIWTQVFTASIGDTEGDHAAAMRLIVDISERKQVENMKDDFLAMVSHELRTPLTAIHAGVGLTASGALGELPPKATRMLTIASENSERLMRLVNDVLDLQRMSAGRIVLDRRPCDAGELVRQAIQAVMGISDAAGISIHQSGLDTSVQADPDRIIQTLTNLIANAVKFSPAGGSVEIAISETDSTVRFDVIDHGRGVPTDQLERIFDRFHQVESSDAHVNAGTGLGLAISEWIVSQHSGKIRVESEVGTGSRFYFELPKG